jgi:hypothetical protein
LLLEWLEDRLVPSVADGSILVATGPSSFSTQDQSSFPAGIVAVDPSTGAQSVLTQGGFFSVPTYIWEAPDGQLYVTDYQAFGTGAVIRVDPSTGQQFLVAKDGLLNGPNVLAYVNGFLYVANTGSSSTTDHSIIQIDPNTGAQTLVTDGSNGGFTVPTGMAPAPGHDVYVADEPGGYNGTDPGGIWKVNLTTGVQTQITHGQNIVHPVDMALDAGGNILTLSAVSQIDSEGAVVRTNPSTGTQTVVSQDGILVGGGDSIEVDPYAGTIYVGTISFGTNPGQIFAVDPITGAQSIVSSGGYLSLVEGIRVYRATVQTAATTTSVGSPVNPSVFGQSLTLTATVSPQSSGSGTPTGTIQFQVDGNNMGNPVRVSSSGTASFTISNLPVGTHTFSASYSGDRNFTASTGSLTETVNQASTSTALTSNANPTVSGQSVTFTAIVSVQSPGAGTPTGMVQFQIDGQNVSGAIALNTSGTASFSMTSLAVGTHTVTASYSGDGSFASSTGSLTGGQSVNPKPVTSTMTAVSSSGNPSVSGQSVTFTATISIMAPGAGTPTGTVQFQIDGNNAGGAVTVSTSASLTTASFTTSTLTTGTHTITASYSGDASFAGSFASLSGGQVVKAATGAGGNVTVTLNAVSQVLTISGDTGNNAITLTQSSGSLNVAGIGTLINQSTSPATFALNSVTEIDISLLNGSDSVTMNGVSIAGTLSVTAGSGSDSFALDTITANTLHISATGPAKDSVSLTNTVAGPVTINMGDNARISLAAVRSNDLVTLMAGSNATVSANGITAAADLDVTVGDNAQAVTVKGSNSYNLNILQTGKTGSPFFDLENDTVRNNLNFNGGDGNNTVVLSQIKVAAELLLFLGAGNNTVKMDHVTAFFGIIDGGTSGNNKYVDGGGNAAFSVFGF